MILMDRAEAIERIENLRSKVWTGAAVVAGEDFKALSMAVDALREQELARNSHDVAQACEWISVEERLPEDDPNVKKHIEGERFGFLTVLVYNGVVKQTNRFFCNEARYGLPKTNSWEWVSQNVTHWMPLPEPPK